MRPQRGHEPQREAREGTIATGRGQGGYKGHIELPERCQVPHGEVMEGQVLHGVDMEGTKATWGGQIEDKGHLWRPGRRQV